MDKVEEKISVEQGNKLIAEFMGFPKVVGMSVWDYDRSLDNAKVTGRLVVNDVNEQGAKFQQKMPFERYGLGYFDGIVFTPSDKTLQKYTPSRSYHSSWDWLMPVIKKLNGGRPHSAMLWEDITKPLIDCDIERTWLAVVKYISWFYKKV